jgi:hypothetical protein
MSFKQDLRKRLFIFLPIIGLALVSGCDIHSDDDGLLWFTKKIVNCFGCGTLLVGFGAFIWWGILHSRKSLKGADEYFTKVFLKHGIQKSEIPAIICQCHSCSKIFIVTQKCSKCGTSAEWFSSKGSRPELVFELLPVDSFNCSCGWGHSIATCSCGTENSAVRMGQYKINPQGGGGIIHSSGIKVL